MSEDPIQVAPDYYRVVFENDYRVRNVVPGAEPTVREAPSRCLPGATCLNVGIRTQGFPAPLRHGPRRIGALSAESYLWAFPVAPRLRGSGISCHVCALSHTFAFDRGGRVKERADG